MNWLFAVKGKMNANISVQFSICVQQIRPVIEIKTDLFIHTYYAYHKVESSRLSQLVAHPSTFRMFMKGKFDAYVLWPLTKCFYNWIVNRSTPLDLQYIKLKRLIIPVLLLQKSSVLLTKMGHEKKNILLELALL